MLAVADVLIASQKRINGFPNYCSIVQVGHRHRLRLDLVLHPDKNRFPFFDAAFRLAAEACSVLFSSVRKLPSSLSHRIVMRRSSLIGVLFRVPLVACVSDIKEPEPIAAGKPYG